MAKTVVGLFDTAGEAQSVVQKLIDNGFSSADISVVANNANGEYATTDGAGSSTAEGAGAGAVGGGVLGGVVGLLVGVGALAIPGIGPVLAAGPLAAALGAAGASTLVGAGIGAAAGGVIGALVGAGIPEEDANFYAEGVKRGGTLVVAKTSDEQAHTAYEVMQGAGAVDVNERGSQWRSSGWDRFDPGADAAPIDGDTTWDRSSKVGTTGGTIAGAAAGAAIGSVGGPVGTVIGGVAGAVTGAGVGAAGDVAGENLEEGDTGTPADRSADYNTSTNYESAVTSPSTTATTYPTGMTPTETTTTTSTEPLFADKTITPGSTEDRTYAATDSTLNEADNAWDRSSKVGTTGGTLAGAATGAAIGSVGGPIGTVIGGVAGAVTGAGVGAAGDAAGESVEEGDADATTNVDNTRSYNSTSSVATDYPSGVTPSDTTYTSAAAGASEADDAWDRSSKVGTTGGALAGAATGAAIGSVGGPVGTVIGGVAGAVTGAGVGAAGDAAGEAATDAYDTYDGDFRTHYDSNSANSGYTYDQYSPVYRYGYGLASDPTYSGSDWATVEPDARRRWEERNPGTWEQFKDSVRYAWDKVRGAR